MAFSSSQVLSFAFFGHSTRARLVVGFMSSGWKTLHRRCLSSSERSRAKSTSVIATGGAFRVFFHPTGNKVLLLLAAYDKSKQPSKSFQNAQIATARKRLREWQHRQKKKTKARKPGSSHV
jgi:hypothetical protein